MEIDITKYNKDSLKFIYDEGVEMLEQTFKSYREVIAKSYTALGIYVTLGTYCTSQILSGSNEPYRILFYMLVGSMLLCFLVLFKNLMPGSMEMLGVKPDRLIHSYYEKLQNNDDQIKTYYKVRIRDLNAAIEKNKIEIDARTKRFWHSVTTAIALTVCVLVIFVTTIL
ncbi:MAG: hypothetical protein R2819_08595 [Allomuricauda sp.]